MKESKLRKASEVDVISNLPDPILHLILSRLPTTEEVIRTSILSTRWRNLWTSVSSLDIDCTRGLTRIFNRTKFKDFVFRVLLANNSLNLDSFRLRCRNYCDMATIGQWIDVAVRRNVKLLDLMFCVGDKYYQDIKLPHCLVTCGSLEVLRLLLFTYHLSSPELTGFPALRVLELNNCYLLNDDLVKYFLKSCPLLEDLSLVDCETSPCHLFCISCPNLKNLRIINRERQFFKSIGRLFYSNRLQICCPKLEFLEVSGFISNVCTFESLNSLKKAVIHPRDTFIWLGEDVCELFARFPHVESLSLHISVVEKYINLENLPKSLPNLKTLELTTKIDEANMHVIIHIFTCSPNLESLHIIVEEGSPYSLSPPEAPDLDLLEMECTSEEVKMVKVTGMSGIPHHMGFIEFCLRVKKTFLKTMNNITPCVNMTK